MMVGFLIWLGVALAVVLLAVWVGNDCDDPYCVYANTRPPIPDDDLTEEDT